MNKRQYADLMESISFSISSVLNENNIDSKEKLMFEQDKLENETWKQMADRVGFTEWYKQLGRNPKDIGNAYMKARQRWLTNACKDPEVIENAIDNYEELLNNSILSDDNYLESTYSSFNQELKNKLENIEKPVKKDIQLKSNEKSEYFQPELEGELIKKDNKLILANVKSLGYDLNISNLFNYLDKYDEPYKSEWDHAGFDHGVYTYGWSEEYSLNVFETTDINKALADYDGQKRTTELLKLNYRRNYRIYTAIAISRYAAEHPCVKSFVPYRFEEETRKYSHCYIPTLGELNAIFYNWFKIRKYLMEGDRYITPFISAWSSTGYDEHSMWCCSVELRSNYENRKCNHYNYPLSDQYMVIIEPHNKKSRHVASFMYCNNN